MAPAQMTFWKEKIVSADVADGKKCEIENFVGRSPFTADILQLTVFGSLWFSNYFLSRQLCYN